MKIFSRGTKARPLTTGGRRASSNNLWLLENEKHFLAGALFAATKNSSHSVALGKRNAMCFAKAAGEKEIRGALESGEDIKERLSPDCRFR